MKDRNEDSYQDDDLAKIMKELEEDDDTDKAQGYNRSKLIVLLDFFSEDKTPSNTPSNKTNKGFNLKQTDIDNYLNV